MAGSNLLSGKRPLEEFQEWLSQVQEDLDKALLSDGTTVSASGYVEVPDTSAGLGIPENGAVLGRPNNTERRLTDDEADKALKNLKKREERPKFRLIKDISKVRIGDRVRNGNGFSMKVTGIFQSCIDSKDGTLYLDFEENEGDVWEEELRDVSWDGNWLSVVFKKLFR
jgi:hypothetical protein